MISWVKKPFIHSSELSIAVENKFCRLLRKSHSFALSNDIKFKSNLVTENDICRLKLGICESPSDISFEIDTSTHSKPRRSALENDSKTENLLQFANLKIISIKAEEIQNKIFEFLLAHVFLLFTVLKHLLLSFVSVL